VQLRFKFRFLVLRPMGHTRNLTGIQFHLLKWLLFFFTEFIFYRVIFHHQRLPYSGTEQKPKKVVVFFKSKNRAYFSDSARHIVPWQTGE
jgi:hypothetical protein